MKAPRPDPPRTPGRVTTGPVDRLADRLADQDAAGGRTPDADVTATSGTGSSPGPALQARNLTKSYTRSHVRSQAANGSSPVLDGLDLSVMKGQLVAIMGPSGSGKSTLLHCLSGMDRPTRGSVLLEDTDMTTLTEPELAALRLSRLGLVLQQPHLLATLCLLDNIVLPGLMAGNRPRSDVVARGRELMKRAGISGLADSDVTEVSGGELQRAGICRALINDPDVVLADEPTGALNSTTAARILDLLAEVHASGTTMVVVTHDAQVATRAERVALLVDGAIVEELSLGRFNQAEAPSRLAAVSEALSRHSV